MSVTIISIIDYEQYSVNGHLVYKDSLRNWACNHDLSVKEHDAFSIYEKLIIKKELAKKKRNYILEYSDSKFTIKFLEV
ncbi:hypothetical protein [Flavobacterium hydatis]|jgi:hypothetical protein|uniref:Uncharacterized protein n=1 Tax=Flavobacterium hydatis TaxID=991 RepID=A0A086AEE0_FLAHY|nr:hypothetical protein [Flavobacterium hydatis]KFF15054.1 hypothetical protein IW20_15435 [Flavobacterium hydatis]OXA91995.1 hypothetical protein B0A62_16495 [Flavobacterium hydatis]